MFYLRWAARLIKTFSICDQNMGFAILCFKVFKDLKIATRGQISKFTICMSYVTAAFHTKYMRRASNCQILLGKILIPPKRHTQLRPMCKTYPASQVCTLKSTYLFVSFSVMYRCDHFREYAELQAKVLEERRKWQEEQEKREKQGS